MSLQKHMRFLRGRPSMRYGHDTLGAARYARRAAKFGTKLDACGILWRGFGKPQDAIRRMAAKSKIIRVHGIWRDDHNFNHQKWTNKALKIGERLSNIASEFPDTLFYYSPFLEHRLHQSKMHRILERVEDATGGLTLVNSPDPAGALVDHLGWFNEIHGNDARLPSGGYIFSLDGTDSSEIAIERYRRRHSNAMLFMLWIPRYNLKRHLHDKTPRWLRTAKPKRDHFVDIERRAGLRA